MSGFTNIDTHNIIQFSNRLHALQQQSQSLFRPYVDMVKVNSEKYMYDRIGLIEARDLNGRYQPVVFDDLDFSRRALLTAPIVVSVGVDEKDVLRLIQSPDSALTEACMNAINRKFDHIVNAAAFADVLTGKNGDTAVSFASDGGRTVNATGGLTYEKLLEIVQNKIDDEVVGDFAFFATGKEHTALMSETELTSGDYSRQFVVDQGSIQKAMGMDVITFGANPLTPVLSVSSGTRSCIAMAKGAILVGMSKEFNVQVEKRNDLYHTHQIIVSGVLGAMRKEGKLIQKVTTTA